MKSDSAEEVDEKQLLLELSNAMEKPHHHRTNQLY